MAKKKKEEVIEEITEQPKVDDTVEKIKVKTKPSMKKFSNDPDGVTKVDLSKPSKIEEDAVSESKTEKVSMDETSGDSGEVGEEKSIIEEVKEEKIEDNTVLQNEEKPILEDVTNKVEEIAIEAEKAITESMETGKELPDNVQKLVDFMEDTGGDINDYVMLNQDYSEMDNHTLLKEYYKRTKPHLDIEEIDFLMEDSFSYDEDSDEERDIKRKKLALKEQVASAKSHLDGLKSKYYEDIKGGSKLTGDQQKAVEFFNRYKAESEEAEAKKSVFTQRTNEVFNDKFKGFEYNIGNKKFRFNVKDASKIKEDQSDINNFTRKFLNRKNEMGDAKGYHKSMFTAMNADAVANHFYEQGKADALKESVAKSKNINMDPRQQHSGVVEAGGIKVRVLGDNSDDFKFKIKNK